MDLDLPRRWSSKLLAAFVLLLVLSAGCTTLRSESTYASKLPADIRPAYDVFAQRCSKCHSLSRPLDSGIDDDAYWALYVRRMRLQPASGISQGDEKVILEFLKYYARDRREHGRTRTPPADAAIDAALPPAAQDSDGGGSAP